MKKESLIIALDKIIESIDNSDIDIVDKIEIMLNVRLFLSEEKYETNIKILAKNNNQF